MRYAIKVVWRDGSEEYVCDGVCGGRVSIFSSKSLAQAQADFLGEGMDDATLVVVKAPPSEKVKP